MELNKIYNTDCIDGMRNIESGSIDAICIDPPYKYLKHKLESDYSEIEFIREAKRVLKKDSLLCTFGRGASFYRLCNLLSEEGFEFKEEVIWKKQKSSSPVTVISRIHETIAIFGLGKGKVLRSKAPYLQIKKYRIDRIVNDVKRIKSGLNNTKELDALIAFLETNSFEYTQDKKQELCGTGVTGSSAKIKGQYRSINTLSAIINGHNEQSIIEEQIDHYNFSHPTQKPVPLLERLIKLISKEGDVILDCFVGSGTTFLSALNTKRNFIGFELDKEYYDLATKRIEQHKNILRLF